MKKNKLELYLDYETTDSMVLQVLSKALDVLELPNNVPMFSYDVDEEKRKIKKLKKSFKIILGYYGSEAHDMDVLLD